MSPKDTAFTELAIRHLLEGDGEPGLDVIRAAGIIAAFESAAYYIEKMSKVANFQSDLALLEYAFGARPADGLLLEFGVAGGRTINKLASLTRETIHGFDVFTGLPETWRTGFAEGTFAQAKLPNAPPHVKLVKGPFEQTLPSFLENHRAPASFIHIDCDLYSSTKTVFARLGERIKPGTVIVFDEYFNYPGWKEHEHLAFQEYIRESGRKYQYIGLVSKHQQVAVRIN